MCLSSSLVPIHSLSRALICCRIGIRAAGLTGALPLLACMPPVTEHLLPYAVGKLYVKWRSFSLELCSLILLLPLLLPVCLVRGNCSDLKNVSPVTNIY